MDEISKVNPSINIDLWYGDKFEPKKYGADAYHNDLTGVYAGNIYNDDGKAIGDYTTTDSLVIEENFNIKWKD